MLQARNNDISPREMQQMTHEREMFELQAHHELRKKELEVQLAELEAKWASWLRIPITIIKLPVYCILALGYVVSAFRQENEPGQNFWDILRK